MDAVALVGGVGGDVAPVENDERLYRGVKREYWKRKKDGTGYYLSSQAFTDPDYRISVYRACLCGHNPSRAQKDLTYYVCSLIAGRVRGIGSVAEKKNDEIVQKHTIEVEPEPLPEEQDDSHAVIYATNPPISSRSVFKRLQEALARCDQYSWEPTFGPSES